MKTFKEIGLNADIVKGLDELGFNTLTPVQEKTIPIILSSRQDLVALAQTGTGKTAAFCLPIIEQIDPNEKGLQALIICPVRELALQISNDIKNYSKYLKHISVVSVYGGKRMDVQLRELKNNVNILVGTPGRTHDLLRRKLLKLEKVKWLVLDEADEMLDMGFKDDLDAILEKTPKDKQNLLFSATMPDYLRIIANKYMKDSLEVNSGQKNIGAEKVEHDYYITRPSDRYEALRRILDSLPNVYGILFCRTKRETQEVASKLIQDRYLSEAIHGDIPQGSRTDIMNRFKNKQFQLLVATDVAARGIDVKDLTHIINYSLPDDSSVYVHRSGRTGRAEKSGICISLINPRDAGKIKMIERKIGKEFNQKKIPLGKDICENRLFNIIDKIKQIKVNEDDIKEYLPFVEEKLAGLDRDELLKRFVWVEFDYFLNLYRKAIDLNQSTGLKNDFLSKKNKNGDFVEYKINFGRQDNFSVKDFFGILNSARNLKGIEIGEIKISSGFTSVEIEAKRSLDFEKAFSRQSFRGRALKAIKSGNRQNSFTQNQRGGQRKFFKKDDKKNKDNSGWRH